MRERECMCCYKQEIGLCIELTSGFFLAFVVIRCIDEDQDSNIESHRRKKKRKGEYFFSFSSEIKLD